MVVHLDFIKILKNEALIHTLVIVYVYLGMLFMVLDMKLPKWFYTLTLYFGFKWITNYRKCTVSYIEVKLRGVKKEQGYLYTLLETAIDYRYSKYIAYVYVMLACFVYYFGLKNGFKYLP